jgi:cell wall-associated NlpC family hydrolase
MIPVELLLSPLYALLAAMGTGILPAGAPSAQLRSTATALDDAGACQRRVNSELAPQWSGPGGAQAIARLDQAVRDTTNYADNSIDIAQAIESASEKVRRAAAELESILDSFLTIAGAMGPALLSPAGIASIIPIAMAHLQRGIDVIEQARAELTEDTERLMALGRMRAGVPSVDTQLGRVGDELGNLADAAFGPVQAAATTTPSTDSQGGAQAMPAGLSATNPGGTGVAITLPDGSIAYAPNERAAKAVRAALSQQGVPYVWGGTTPGQGLDCSGLTQWAYREAGVELPRLAQEQDTAGVAVSQGDLQPGDLAVWSGHVAMYVGNGQLVEAGDPVSVSPLRTTNMGQTFEGFYRPR